MTSQLDAKTVREILDYDSESGEFFWKRRPKHYFPADKYWKLWNRRQAGKPALSTTSDAGYCYGPILNRNYLAHRIAWLHHYGVWPGELRHIDGKKGNNAITNLCEAIRQSKELNNGH